FRKIHQDDQPDNGNDRADSAVDYTPHIKWLGNEPPRGAHHLHRLDQETVAEHSQPDGIVDQEQHHHGHESADHQHHQSYLLRFIQHLAHQRTLVEQFADNTAVGNIIFDHLQAVG